MSLLEFTSREVREISRDLSDTLFGVDYRVGLFYTHVRSRKLVENMIDWYELDGEVVDRDELVDLFGEHTVLRLEEGMDE